MLIINSSRQILVGKAGEIIQKMLDKNLLLNSSAAIEEQIQEIEKWSEEAKDSMIRVIDRHQCP